MGLRVGLTGGLGSGKSTVAAMLAERGAYILSADEIARELMEPGQPVYDAVVRHFGPSVLGEDRRLDRAALGRLAFAEGRVEELNELVHPATIAQQAERTAALHAREPQAVVVVESALLFETRHGAGWRERFDRLILVTAPEPVRISRFVSRSGPNAGPREQLEAEARRRLARQMPDELKAPECDFVVENRGTLEHLRAEVDRVWDLLIQENSLA